MSGAFRFNDTLVDAILQQNRDIANEVERRLEQWFDYPRAEDGDATAVGIGFAQEDDTGFNRDASSGRGITETEILPVVGGGGTFGISRWTSSDTDVTGLVSGTTAGGAILGPAGGHVGVLLRENEGGDSFVVLSGGGNFTSDTTWDTTAMRVYPNGQTEIAGVMRAANGSTAAPAFSFKNDTDTGLMLQAVGTASIAVGGSRVLDWNKTFGTALLVMGTTGSAANVHATASNILQKVTSGGQFKEDRAVISRDDALKLFDADPVTWRSTADGDLLEGEDRRYAGWVAEHFAAAGLHELVNYDTEGRAEAIQYDRVPAYMMVLIKELWNAVFRNDPRSFPNTPDSAGAGPDPVRARPTPLLERDAGEGDRPAPGPGN